jgi:CRP-like cAMP-binding protein
MEAKITEFFSQYSSHAYAKGQVLILNGERPDHIYFLEEGRVKQYDVTYRGEEVILNVFKPNAFFPMSMAINNTDNPYLYEAETNVVVRQAPAIEVVDFVKANPDVLFDLLSRVYRGLDGILGRMAFLMASGAKGRLMYELIIESRRFGKQLGKGEYIILSSEKELGARAGLSRETVSRAMAKLKKEGILRVTGKEIHILDIQALEQKIGKEF